MEVIIPAAKAAEHILRAQKQKDGAEWRPLAYQLRESVPEGELLYNVLTRELLLLSSAEAAAMDEPGPVRDELIARWFLVPAGQDDHALAQSLMGVASSLEPSREEITSYTVMTTMDCNARCFYCYELGRARTPMAPGTAERLAGYMAAHSGGKKLHISWFGGEPLYNMEVIDLICEKLRGLGQEYRSTMITNGYLFDAETVRRAAEDWKLEQVQITLDGTEKVYNRSKAYIYKDGVSPYRRVLGNIDLLLETRIAVSVRLNLGDHNGEDLFRLVDELAERWGGRPGLSVYSNPLFEANDFGVLEQVRARREETFRRQLELEDYIRQKGLGGRSGLRRGLRLGGCMADNDGAVVVTPDGHIGKCEHFSESEFCSHIDSGEWDWEMLQSWKEKAEEVPECAGCPCWPECYQLKKCPNAYPCFPEARLLQERRLRHGMLGEYRRYLRRQAAQEEQESEPQQKEC